MKILVVDNFDSFTYNLVHYLEALDCEVSVIQNNQIDAVKIQHFDKVILSPGPNLPQSSGELLRFIELYHKNLPFLGVCLGMQALAHFFGENLINLEEVKHGVSEKLKTSNKSLLFKNMPSEFEVGLYHSWCVSLNDNSKFVPTAMSESGVLMAIEHENLPLYGVQFHPESILTEYGKEILRNFIEV